ncbi:MAG: hypothetical protein ACOVS5_17225 [Oligoflexus sp.]|jgi:hypothetical protein
MKIRAAFIGLALTACTTVPSAMDVEGKVDSWLGMDSKTMKSIWGEPTQEVGVGEDTKVVQYAAPSTGDDACTVVLTLNAKGEVIGTKWNGTQKSCAQFVKASPAYEASMAEETNMAILEAIDTVKF